MASTKITCAVHVYNIIDLYDSLRWESNGHMAIMTSRDHKILFKYISENGHIVIISDHNFIFCS